MIRSLRSLAAIVCLAAVAIAIAIATVTVTYDKIVAIGGAITMACQSFARHMVDVLAPVPADDRAPAVRIVQAKAFVQRLTRRARPLVTNTWRMCPST